ncbi:hypothetical protein KEM54_003528 [Ascosphaera aggregata]|nr:hypothetical protein KEM54_003528 [Ascosphaera aggregata]
MPAPTLHEMTISHPQRARTGRTLECLRMVLDFAKSFQKCLIAAEERITASQRTVTGGNSVDRTSLDEATHVIDSISVSALDDVIAAISSLPSNVATAKYTPGVLPLAEDAHLESLATRLWNHCTRVMRMIENMSIDGQDVLLDTTCRVEENTGFAVEFRILIKAAEKGHLDLGLRVLEKAAPREDRISSRCTDDDLEFDTSHDEKRILRRLSAEYHILRISLSWRQRRLDLAEHLFTKVSKTCIEQESSTAEALADLCYEIGTTHLEGKDFPLAVRWLERAADALAKHELEKLSADADELRLAVWHSLGFFATFIGSKKRGTAARTPEIRQKLTASHRLDLAKDALYQLIFQRLGLQSNPVLIGKGFVTYVWMQTSDSGSDDITEQLHSSATKLHSMRRESLNAEATYACLILIWKRIDQCFGLRDYATAEKWLQLARHPIFDNSGETNKSKISRVALLDDDLNLATSCIEDLCQQGSEGKTYVQACVAESQRTGKTHHAALALQRLLNDMLESSTFDAVQLPVLLRCTARLLMSETDSSEPQRRDIENELCNIFDAVAAMVQAENYLKAKKGVNPFTLTELEWFSKNSYNIAVQHCSTWAPRNIQRLLIVSMKLTEFYPNSLESGIVEEVKKRRMLCNFLCAIICMAQARAHPDPQGREEHYATSRKHILGFRQYLLEHTNLDEESLERHRTVLAFDFEAALRLHNFTDLSDIVEEAHQYANEELYAIFIDAILGSDAPLETVAVVFQQIIIYVVRDNRTDTTTVSRWLRCLFQLALDSNVSIAETVLEQAYAVARDAHHQHLEGKMVDICYPSEEVEWLATMGFNKAIDLYLSGDDEACRRWASRALDMAGLLHDKGTLFQLLKGKMSSLELE